MNRQEEAAKGQGWLYELSDISFSYHAEGVDFQALRNINIRIAEGEFVAIVGSSGSGKTTLMNLLGLLSTPSEGSFSFFGEEIHEFEEFQLADLRNSRIGFVFQHFALLPRLSVLDNILLPFRFSAHQDENFYRERALKLLTDLGVGGLENRFPAELSGGQKQRVAICRALVMDPKIILADEPTGALDSKTTEEVLGILKELHASGYTILLITHDMHVASMALRRITLSDGQVESDVLEGNPLRKTTATARLIASKIAPLQGILQRFSSSVNSWTKAIQGAFGNLWANRLRSFLTGLGLLIGVCSIVVIAGLSEVAQNVFNSMFYNAGTSKVYVYFDRDKSSALGVRYWRGMNIKSDFPSFADKFAKYGKFRPFVRAQNCMVQSQNQPTRASLNGMYDLGEFKELDTPLEKGRIPSEIESLTGANVVVLGKDSVDALFAKNDPGRGRADFPLGELLTVGSCNVLLNLRVVGVLGAIDTSFGRRDANDVLYLPSETLLRSMGETNVSFFSILPNRDVNPRWLADNVTNYLTTRAGEKFKFTAAIPSEIIEKIRGFLLAIQALTGFIGALCIVVGGIGIMNIMIVTVTERIREIGILKSQGAKPYHIRNQFVIESVTLCLVSGILGVVLGLAITNGLSFIASFFQGKNASFQLIFAPLGIFAGVFVSFACGVGFGFLPALRASRMEPAECMREE